MAAMRQRVPFRFSENDGTEGHVLDEQEQEEVIDSLRQESANSNAVYLAGLQAVVTLSLALHILFMLRSEKHSPLAVLFPDAPSGPPVPFATLLAIFQIAIHCNLFLNVLPKDHTLRGVIQSSPLSPSLRPPFPFSHPGTLFAPVVAPAYALVLGRGWVDVLWWATAGVLTAIVGLALKWMKEEEEEIAGLENLRYVARGA
ncbi:hypothetical protein C8Q77DRAFT_904600 [Trametes polyzona]|nr:hypothetical protein C8Q77DRAFT_904600 [Trametes polyzona]